jgi:hypothetical protein
LWLVIGDWWSASALHGNLTSAVGRVLSTTWRGLSVPGVDLPMDGCNAWRGKP